METSKKWLTTIEITQIPNLEGNGTLSWLFNPFMDNTIYGVRFQVYDEIFSLSFILNSDTRGEALKLGFRLLSHLNERFPGIEGKVKVEKEKSEKTLEIDDFYELKLPELSVNDKICILSKIINLFKINPGHEIEFFILWQRDNIISSSLEAIGINELLKVSEEFRIKIFISIGYNYDLERDFEEQESEIKGYVDSFKDFQNEFGKKALFVQSSLNTYNHILYGGQIKHDLISNNSIVAHPITFDLSLPESLPIKKPDDKIYGGLEFKKEKDETKILLGNLYIDGIKRKRKAYIYLKNFVHHILIAGLSGAGKSSLFSHLNTEIRSKASHVGNLIINLEKKNEHLNYDIDILLKFGDLDLRIPYFIRGEDMTQTMEDVASYLIAAVGLKGIVQTNMYNVLEAEIKEKGDPPRYLKTLFEKLKLWFKTHRYPDEFHNAIMMAIENRIIKITSDPVVSRILELPPTIPSWFKAWLNGKTVFIDLSRCNMTIKRLLTLAIFQMIRVYMPETRKNELKNIIFLDEIGSILTSPMGKSKKDDDFITSFYINDVFSQFLGAFRSRGISLVIAGNRAALLFPNVSLMPNTKILFRTEQISSKLFTNRLDEQDDLFLQQRRKATIYDGVNTRKFSFYTTKVFRGE